MPTNHTMTRVPALRRTLPSTLHRPVLLATAMTALAVTVIVGLSSTAWIGTAFPGFFVLPNRVVPSISRDGWSGSRDGAIFQRTVVAVDGRAVTASADAYRAAAARPAGTTVEYTLRDGGSIETVTLESRTFSTADYWIVFGSYLATGLLYLWVGVLAVWLRPDSSVGRALLLLGGTGGIYALTGAGIYDVAADLRVHALAEAFFPATLVSLAVAFLRGRTRIASSLGGLAWWMSCALAIPYQLMLDQPGAYSVVHAACETYAGVAGLALGATLLIERARDTEDAGPLLRASLAGALLGIGVPAVIMVLSGLSGGVLPVNLVTVTAFCFPLCIGFGLLREHVVLQREAVASPA